MTYNLLLDLFTSFFPSGDINEQFWMHTKLRTLEMLFELQTVLKPADRITLSDLEQLLLDDPFYLASYQEARQYLNARYHAQELDEKDFHTQLTRINKRCGTWINEPAQTKGAIKLAIKNSFDSIRLVFR
jgi:hypothetical protein